MKHVDLTEFKYSPPTVDLANTFDIVEKQNDNGTFDMFYNLNIGCSVVGMDDIPKKYVTMYTIKHGDCLKSISYKLYNTIDFWWVLAKINQIDDVLEELTPGTKLRCLEIGVMGNIYSEIKRISEYGQNDDTDD